jgi:hypothetical protein
VEHSQSDPGPLASRVAAVGRKLRAAGVQVVYVVPPVQPCEPPDDVGPIAAALAREFPVWDYGASPLPPGAFRDCSHLDRSARASFTQALAEQAAGEGLLHAVAGRLR